MYHNYCPEVSLYPELMQSIDEYLMNGTEPLLFLQFMFRGQRNKAGLLVPSDYLRILREITINIAWICPKDSYGSPRLYENWINDVDGVRTTYARERAAEVMTRILKS